MLQFWHVTVRETGARPPRKDSTVPKHSPVHPLNDSATKQKLHATLPVEARQSTAILREPNWAAAVEMAERMGFEPMIRLLAVYSLSRRAPSTTRSEEHTPDL